MYALFIPLFCSFRMIKRDTFKHDLQPTTLDDTAWSYPD